MNAITPRVLLVDDDHESSRLIAGRLATRGFEALCAEGIGDALVGDAKAKAASFHPHVIVLDWRLHGPYNDESACEALLEALPSCGKIIYSEWATLQQADHVRERFDAHCVGKEDAPDEIIAKIEHVLTEQCGYGWRVDGQPFEVDWPHRRPRPAILARVLGHETAAPEDLLDGLVWQLFQPKHPGDDRSVARISLLELDGNVRNSPLPSPGHAVVLAAELTGQYELVVTKIAEKSHIGRERRNFDRFVHRKIAGGFYSHLLSHAYFHDLGALEYTLVGGPFAGVVSFAAWERDNDAVPRIVKPLKHFFGTAWRGHYQNSRPYDHPLADYDANGNHKGPRPAGWRACLYELYDPSLRLSERIRAFPDQRAAQPAPGLPGFELPNPMAWLQQHREDSVVPGARVAITHGDLHGGNLLVDAEHAWAIDFERTGWGHSLRDFVELEVDLVTRLMALPSGGGPAQFVRLAVALASNLEPSGPLLRQVVEAEAPAPGGGAGAAGDMAKVIKVVLALRRIMNEIAKPNDPREYLWGLLLDTAFAAAWATAGSEARAGAAARRSTLRPAGALVRPVGLARQSPGCGWRGDGRLRRGAAATGP